MKVIFVEGSVEKKEGFHTERCPELPSEKTKNENQIRWQKPMHSIALQWWLPLFGIVETLGRWIGAMINADQRPSLILLQLLACS